MTNADADAARRNAHPETGDSEHYLTRDDVALEGLGYKPELKRSFSKLETFGVAFSIMGVVPSIGSTIMYCLPYGGPVGMIWGWVLSAFLISFIGFAMGDLASSMPTSGGLYYWTHRLSPPEYRNFLSWFAGYNSFLGNTAATSSLAWACAGMFYAAASIANEDFAPSTGAKFGLYCGILIFCGLFCSYCTTAFARMQTPATVLNLALALVTIIGLPIARRHELGSAKWTFGGWGNLSNWPNGFAFFLSMLAPVWTICSFDCAVSISEEASNAAIAVPGAITGSIGLAGVLGTVIMIVLAATMGNDLEAINDSPIGQPLAYIYLQAFGKTGTLVLWSFMIIAQMSMTSSLLLPASRQAFAFARDGALPFSSFLYKVDRWSGTPVRTVWLVVGAAIPLGALGFADPVNESAINAIFALAILGPYVAYFLPIFSRLLWGQDSFKPGPWYLGKWSRPVAWVACGWMVFAAVLFCFPADRGPDAGSMNYAIVVAGGVWAFATGYYYFPKYGGKTFFTGPRTEDLSADIIAHAQEDAHLPPGLSTVADGSDGYIADPNKRHPHSVTTQAVDDDSDDDVPKIV
ncbi:polyamine transporter tpo5 [Vanrija albida]|uniref:Polyamine transporter tpo5 n=1 Tax=Vanrija albida TaxID=181172 RepID=A0ABR3QG87_9TREE